jgi:hypothetical protein
MVSIADGASRSMSEVFCTEAPDAGWAASPLSAIPRSWDAAVRLRTSACGRWRTHGDGLHGTGASPEHT